MDLREGVFHIPHIDYQEQFWKHHCPELSKLHSTISYKLVMHAHIPTDDIQNTLLRALHSTWSGTLSLPRDVRPKQYGSRPQFWCGFRIGSNRARQLKGQEPRNAQSRVGPGFIRLRKWYRCEYSNSLLICHFSTNGTSGKRGKFLFYLELEALTC